MKTKWVCVTKDWDTFTYGKVYEGKLDGSLLDVKNDRGERWYPALFGSGGVYYFIPIEEWREKQINKIL